MTGLAILHWKLQQQINIKQLAIIFNLRITSFPFGRIVVINAATI